MQTDILEIGNLSVTFRMEREEIKAVDRVSFTMKKGCTTGIVGESGSGKSVTALAIMHLLSSPATIIHSDKMLLFDQNGNSTDINKLDNRQMRHIRGNRISMIFQEPMTSLNPVTRCGNQVVEAVRAHQALSRHEAKMKTLEIFREVLLPRPEDIFYAFPHELSGGQKQRVMIAMAVASRPDVLIADEPTTALDVSVQKSIIQLLKDLKLKYGMAILFITHDLGLISGIADELLVMKNGKIVESGPVKDIFSDPKHPYTSALLASRLSMDTSQDKPREIYLRKPLLETDKLKTYFPVRSHGKRKRTEIKAVDGISLQVFQGEVLGLVGESGCGKTTLGRSILRLIEPTGGKILFQESDITAIRRGTMKKMRKDLQIIFQDPYSSLNPKLTVGTAVTEPMTVHGIGHNRRERKEMALALLEKVGLDQRYFHRYPHELSGGQRQRVSIARALSVHPKFIVCDESVSALDVTIRAQVLNLLKELKDEFGFTYIFISHDLSVVKYISDRIAVMKDGKIVETGTADEIYHHPKSDYTKNLLASIPI